MHVANIDNFIQKHKNRKLIQLGMYDTKPGGSDEFEEFTNDMGKTCHRVPWDISDEDYKRLKLYVTSDESKSAIAELFKWIAICIYIIGALVGIIIACISSFANKDVYLVWIITFLSGTGFLGFHAIISLLHNINSKLL